MKDTKICLHDFLCFSSFDELCEPQKVFLRLCRISGCEADICLRLCRISGCEADICFSAHINEQSTCEAGDAARQRGFASLI